VGKSPTRRAATAAAHRYFSDQLRRAFQVVAGHPVSRRCSILQVHVGLRLVVQIETDGHVAVVAAAVLVHLLDSL
jgi:hypothetical protein